METASKCSRFYELVLINDTRLGPRDLFDDQDLVGAKGTPALSRS